MTYNILSAARKSSSEITTTSTSDWREWWAIEARHTGTDWRSLLATADAALSRLRAARVMVGALSS